MRASLAWQEIGLRPFVLLVISLLHSNEDGWVPANEQFVESRAKTLFSPADQRRDVKLFKMFHAACLLSPRLDFPDVRRQEEGKG